MSNIELEFESNYRDKLLYIRFVSETVIASKSDVLAWRSQWTSALKSWHSPYKAIIDVSNLKEVAKDQEVAAAFENMGKFLKGFFLRKAACFGNPTITNLPFENFPTEEQASEYLGVRKRKASVPGDFRSSIVFENHFRQHVVELSFAEPVVISTEEQVKTLHDKLTNNLMQWHSKWSLLVDCSNITNVDPSLTDSFEKAFRALRGFFMKQVIGYMPQSKESQYPFKVYRSRHKAAAALENEGLTSGDDANCSSRENS